MSRNIRKRFESFKFKRQSDTQHTLSGFTDGLTDTNSNFILKKHFRAKVRTSKGQGKSFNLLNCWEDRCVGSNVRQQFSFSPPPVWGQQCQKTVSILPSAGTTLSKNLSSLSSMSHGSLFIVLYLFPVTWLHLRCWVVTTSYLCVDWEDSVDDQL